MYQDKIFEKNQKLSRNKKTNHLKFRIHEKSHCFYSIFFTNNIIN
ncbi:hypothetical protein THALO_420080 [Tenacibaculum halocynthiae]